ncbi:MAG: hypothetical protein ACLPJH_07540 [Myxococcaceae bacterium]
MVFRLAPELQWWVAVPGRIAARATRRSPVMAASSNSLFASTRHSKAIGLLVAGAMLFAVGVGGSGALLAAYTGANSVAAVHGAA